MKGVLLLSLFQRRLGAHQAADYIPPVSLLIASSLIDDGRLRTPSKCSAHLFKIASLSVLIIAPGQEANGDNLAKLFSIFYKIMICWVNIRIASMK